MNTLVAAYDLPIGTDSYLFYYQAAFPNLLLPSGKYVALFTLASDPGGANLQSAGGVLLFGSTFSGTVRGGTAGASMETGSFFLAGQSVPEPTTALGVGSALGLLFAFRRKRFAR